MFLQEHLGNSILLFLTDGKRPVLELRLKSHSKFSHTALTGTQLCVGRKANGVELGVLGLNFGAFLSHRVGSQYRVPILASKAAFRLESSHPPPSLRCKAGDRCPPGPLLPSETRAVTSPEGFSQQGDPTSVPKTGVRAPGPFWL